LLFIRFHNIKIYLECNKTFLANQFLVKTQTRASSKITENHIIPGCWFSVKGNIFINITAILLY